MIASTPRACLQDRQIDHLDYGVVSRRGYTHNIQSDIGFRLFPQWLNGTASATDWMDGWDSPLPVALQDWGSATVFDS